MKELLRQFIDLIEGQPSLAEHFHSMTKQQQFDAALSIADMPEAWHTIHFKTYPRLIHYALADCAIRSSQLSRALRERRSTRCFCKVNLAYEDLSYLLKRSGGISNSGDTLDDSRRSYPSAGARYPLEIYLVALRVDGLNKGLYHYDVKHDLLELLYEKDLTDNIIDAFGNEVWLGNASILIVITGILRRTQVKYGDRGYRYMLIEAGHLAQNTLLLTQDLGLGACTIGGFDDDKVAELMDIAIQREWPLYAVAIGAKEAINKSK